MRTTEPSDQLGPTKLQLVHALLRTGVGRNAFRVTALLVCLVLYGAARLPRLPAETRTALASRFAFEAQPLPELPGRTLRTVRSVHPSLERIAAWISSVGAAVALGDLDGDGLPNDLCHVDPRVDEVIVAPVPGTGSRYPVFALRPEPLLHDRSTTAPMGCVPADLNEDGRMDLLVYYWGRPPVAHLRRVGGARPAEGPVRSPETLGPEAFKPVALGAPGERWYTNAATRADVDGDGHIDLVIGNYFPDGARILDATGSGGESMQDSMSRAFNGGRNRLLLWVAAESGWEPGVTFADAGVVPDEEVAHGWALAVGAADLDRDLLPELYFAHDFGPDRLLHNRSRPGQPELALVEGTRGLTSPRSKILGWDSFKGMGVDFADLNGDGLLDLYVSNIAEEYALEESHFAFVSTGRPELLAAGIAPYVDRSEPLGLSRSGWGWESKLADFDNDGVPEAIQATGFVKGTKDRWPELHELAMGNDLVTRHPWLWPRFLPGDDLSGDRHNPFFVRAPNGRYFDLAPELGLDALQVSRGIAVADVDGDGDLDFAVANQWERSVFYRNEAPRPGAHLVLHLLQPTAGGAGRVLSGPPTAGAALGWPAVGAEATVVLPDGRRLVSQVDGGNGHSGVRSPELHFGLGAVEPERPLPVTLRWRDPRGAVRTAVHHLAPGRYTVLLGSSHREEGS